jgi:Uma2 family endonuclease
MSTSPKIKTYTLEGFWALPDPPDRMKLELIAGVLYMSPPPDSIHDNTFARLNRSLMGHLIATDDPGNVYSARAAIWTGPDTYVEPDLFYVSAELAARLDPNQRFSADWVAEIVSPGSEVYDRTTKADTYAALGVRELWLLYSLKKIVDVRVPVGGVMPPGRVYRLGERIESTVFPDWKPLVDDLFR